jgi:uncharacterized lipoprotein YmbA
MTMLTRRACWTMALLPPLLAACASPNPTLYMLSPVQGSSADGGPKVVVLRGIGLARYLERSQIVRSSEGNRLDVLAGDWWGEPLGAMMSRVLVENLSQRMPGTSVFSESGAISADADATVEVNIQRMDADQNGTIVLLAQVAVLSADSAGPSLRRSERLTVTPTTPGTGGAVGAMSIALGQLSDTIVTLCRQAVPAAGRPRGRGLRS